jgi:hypothetical protein
LQLALPVETFILCSKASCYDSVTIVARRGAFPGLSPRGDWTVAEAMSSLKSELKKRVPLLLVTAAVIAISLPGYTASSEQACPAVRSRPGSR